MANAPLEPPLAGDLLELEVGGEVFSGWEEVEVTRNLEAISGSFRLVVNPTPRQAWPIRPGDEIKLRVGDETLLTGYVDQFEGTSTKDQGRRITVTGRDRTADLVDCSETSEPGQWFGLYLDQVASEIAAPFGVAVTNKVSRKEPFPIFKVNPGESAWTAIDRACRLRATLAFSDGSGDIVLAPPGLGTSEADLIEGEGGNVLSSSVHFNSAGRFSEYIVRGQQRGTDGTYGEASAGVEGRAADPEIVRFRPVVIVAEGQVDVAAARARAEWEATTRAARGASVEVVVQGWRELPDGFLWSPNRLVYVNLASWQIAESMMIRAARFTRSRSSGQRTTLSLVRRDAYTPTPEVDPDADPFATLLEGGDLDG